jgi:formylglycine-generating enzyme required for sulfatase activity
MRNPETELIKNKQVLPVYDSMVGDSNEKPVHRVSVGKFAMGKFEVTVGEYMKFVKATNTHVPLWLEKGSSYNIKTGTDNNWHGSSGVQSAALFFYLQSFALNSRD